MADSEWGLELAKIGYLAQEKFDFYVVALAFTVLGLAIQTAHFGGRPLSDVLELLGWSGLMTSGIGGLFRLQHQPHVYQFMGLQANQESRLAGLRKAREQGTTVIRTLDTSKTIDIETLITKDEETLNKIETKVKEIQAKAGIGYRVQSVGLIAGLLALMAARGLGPLFALLGIR